MKRIIIICLLVVSFLCLALVPVGLAQEKSKYSVYSFYNGPKDEWRIVLVVTIQPDLWQTARVWKVIAQNGVVYWLPVDQTVIVEIPRK